MTIGSILQCRTELHLTYKFKMAKHLTVTITDTSLTVTRKQDQINAEAALDGIYVLRTSVPTDQLDPPGVVLAYKNLAHSNGTSHHQDRRPGPTPDPPPTRLEQYGQLEALSDAA